MSRCVTFWVTLCNKYYIGPLSNNNVLHGLNVYVDIYWHCSRSCYLICIVYFTCIEKLFIKLLITKLLNGSIQNFRGPALNGCLYFCCTDVLPRAAWMSCLVLHGCLASCCTDALPRAAWMSCLVLHGCLASCCTDVLPRAARMSCLVLHECLASCCTVVLPRAAWMSCLVLHGCLASCCIIVFPSAACTDVSNFLLLQRR